MYGIVEANIVGVGTPSHLDATQRCEDMYGSGMNLRIEFRSNNSMYGEGMAARAHTSSPQRESAYRPRFLFGSIQIEVQD